MKFLKMEAAYFSEISISAHRTVGSSYNPQSLNVQHIA
jgi:hypothetical protein